MLKRNRKTLNGKKSKSSVEALNKKKVEEEEIEDDALEDIINNEEEEEVIEEKPKKKSRRKIIKKQEEPEEEEIEDDDNEEENNTDETIEEIEDEEEPEEEEVTEEKPKKRHGRVSKKKEVKKEEPEEEIDDDEEEKPKKKNKKIKEEDNWLYTTKKPIGGSSSREVKYSVVPIDSIIGKITEDFEKELNANNSKDDKYKYIKKANIKKIVKSFEKELFKVTEEHTVNFLGATIRPVDRKGRVFSNPALSDFDTFKDDYSIRTYSKDIGQPDKYRGTYDDENKVFHATSKYNYETKEWDKVKKNFKR